MLFEAELFLGKGIQYEERKRRFELALNDIGFLFAGFHKDDFIKITGNNAAELRKHLQLLNEKIKKSFYSFGISNLKFMAILIWKMKYYERLLILPIFKEQSQMHNNNCFEHTVVRELEKLRESVLDGFEWSIVKCELEKLCFVIDQKMKPSIPEQKIDEIVPEYDDQVIEHLEMNEHLEKSKDDDELIKGSLIGDEKRIFLSELENALSLAF